MIFRNFSKNITFILALLCTQLAFAQTTLIPDTNFEQALINLGYDNLIDGEVLTANINTVENLNLDNMNISDLTGIQAFDSLVHFSCNVNSLTAIDLSQNPNLFFLDCRFNQLTSLNTSQYSNLTSLYCSDNLITNLDFSQNIELKYLDCSNNPISNLNVTLNPELYWLRCNNMGLTGLDISQNAQLQILECNNNQLTSLDFSQNPDLITLRCDNNLLSSLNPGNTSAMGILSCKNNFLTQLETGNLVNLESLVCDSNNISSLILNPVFLQIISCSYNQLNSLDLSQSNSLSFVECTHNDDLTYIDARNTLASSLNTLNATNNPNLACIITDDSTYNHSTNWQYDTLITQVVETEAACGISLGVSAFNTEEKVLIYPNPSTSFFSIQSLEHVEGVEVYNLSGRLIQSIPYQDVYSTEEFSKGVYIIRLEYSNHSDIRMLVVE